MRPGGRTLERGRNRRSPSPGGCLSLDEPLTGQTPANEHERTFASFGWAVACSAAVLPREGSSGAAPDACRPRRTSLCMRTYVSINKLKLHPRLIRALGFPLLPGKAPTCTATSNVLVDTPSFRIRSHGRVRVARLQKNLKDLLVLPIVSL